MEFIISDTDANEQLIYFTSSSLSSDDSTLFFISDSGGEYNIWCKNLQTGESKKLSDNKNGVLKSYVYFRGNNYKGIGKASISINSDLKKVYYIQDRDIVETDTNANIRVISTLPLGQMTAFTHISSDGKFLCVPTTDARALEDEDNLPLTYNGEGKLNFDIDKRVHEENLNSYIRVFNVENGEEVLCEQVNKAWITHVQFSPTDSSKILYNHEWPYYSCGSRRMWLYDNGEHICIRPDSDKHSKDDWACHEMWTPDGKEVIYHGGYKNGPFFVGKMKENMELAEISLDKDYTGYGHFTMGNKDKNLLVTDGYYTDKGDNGHNIISVVISDFDKLTLEFKPLCAHNSDWASQDSHPHPIFSHDDKYVYFTSAINGKLKIAREKVWFQISKLYVFTSFSIKWRNILPF